jgi:hypothetical protein
VSLITNTLNRTTDYADNTDNAVAGIGDVEPTEHPKDTKKGLMTYTFLFRACSRDSGAFLFVILVNFSLSVVIRGRLLLLDSCRVHLSRCSLSEGEGGQKKRG